MGSHLRRRSVWLNRQLVSYSASRDRQYR
jgi:hypothetical protein